VIFVVQRFNAFNVLTTPRESFEAGFEGAKKQGIRGQKPVKSDKLRVSRQER
jgi:hypothetical protein